jgi:hypothetical protein
MTGKMRQASDATTLTELINWQLSSKRVTYRHYGPNGEYRRPMVHRFEVKDGAEVTSALVENITRSNPLFRRLAGK